MYIYIYMYCMYVCIYILIKQGFLTKSFTIKNIIHLSIICFMNMMTNIFHRKLFLKDVVGYYNDHKHNGMKVEMKNMLKQLYMMKHALEKRKVKKLIQFQIKKLSINVEYYYNKQSVYYNMKDKDMKYYPQVLIEQYVYKTFSNNTIIHPDLEFTDSEPDSESNNSNESEEEINENTV